MASGYRSETADDDTQNDRNRSLPGRTGALDRRSFLTAAAGAAAVPLLAKGVRAQSSEEQSSASGEPRRIEVVSTGSEQVDYEITATGRLDPVVGATEGKDSVTENDDGTWTATGMVRGRGRDTYTYEGQIDGLSPTEGAFEVRVDGITVATSEVASGGVEESIPVASELLGGGEGYPSVVPESDATVVVSSVGELVDALDSASSGDVVYVAGDATIDIGSRELTIPSGVTLASDRGIDGAAGGEILASEIEWEGALTARDDVRVAGVRISGPTTEYREYSKPVHSGVIVRGSGVEIDNAEISGFNHAGVKAHSSVHLHHSNVHSNPMDGLGYGIMCYAGGGTLVEYNQFNYNRHSVANEGTAGYEVRYNHFGEEAVAYQVGTHRPGATTLKIHHNTFPPTTHVNSDKNPDSHISIRGVPDNIADIHNNWFYSTARPSPGRGPEAIIQPHVSEFTNLKHRNNHYGEDEPAADIGCPR
ncbi:right-handed parallel beta-helix repeat-containing protein [Halosimplex salinum]|uniref:right-handed parallel beta-helix repeat-containing protein n=1 Tax=Halosimplex salinum TaxID=1710538 RepID=UPI000F4A2B95|nr:right-handed parallel beta-helix repeat-containing protein [Halosimplex salinum]